MNKKITHKKAVAMLKIAVTLALIVNTNAFIEYLKVEKPSSFVFYSPYNLPKIATETAFASESGTEVSNQEDMWLVGEFSAYSPSVDETDDDPYTNAANKRVKTGDLACPSMYKFGTKIEIKGLGVFECWDRMAGKNEGKFDVFMWTKAEAFDFGRKKGLEYRVLD